jgi:hypothetical protein
VNANDRLDVKRPPPPFRVKPAGWVTVCRWNVEDRGHAGSGKLRWVGHENDVRTLFGRRLAYCCKEPRRADVLAILELS